MQFRHKPVPISPDHLLRRYWGEEGAFRPTVEVVLKGPGGVLPRLALLDTGSAYTVFDHEAAAVLGVAGRLNRRIEARGAGGEPLPVAFADDGAVSLLLTDFQTAYCACAPLVGFLPAPPAGARGKPTAILGFTGALQHMDVSFLAGPPALIRIEVKADLPAARGAGPPPGDVWSHVPVAG